MSRFGIDPDDYPDAADLADLAAQHAARTARTVRDAAAALNAREQATACREPGCGTAPMPNARACPAHYGRP